jgi:hypothetical protein
MEYYRIPQTAQAAQFDVGVLLKGGAGARQSLGSVRERELEDGKLARAQKIYDEERAWKLEDRAMQQDRYKLELAEKSATNEAISAILDPKKYQTGKIAGEQNAIEQSLSALSPADRAIAEQQIKANYNPNASGDQWLSAALGSANADQSKLLSTKKSVYDIAASTPGTPEYEANVKADKELYSWKQGLEHKNRMSQIAASKTPEKVGTTDFYKKNEDGSITTVKIPNTKESYEMAKGNGFTMGEWNKGTAAEKKADYKFDYDAKDVDTLLGKVAKWNIIGGDKDSAIADVDKIRATLKNEKTVNAKGETVPKYSEKKINDIIGSSLSQAISDDEYDSSVFSKIITSRVTESDTIAPKADPVDQTVVAPTEKVIESNLSKEDLDILKKIPVSTFTQPNGVIDLNKRDEILEDIKRKQSMEELLRMLQPDQASEKEKIGLSNYINNRGTGFNQSILGKSILGEPISIDVIAK